MSTNISNPQPLNENLVNSQADVTYWTNQQGELKNITHEGIDNWTPGSSMIVFIQFLGTYMDMSNECSAHIAAAGADLNVIEANLDYNSALTTITAKGGDGSTFVSQSGKSYNSPGSLTGDDSQDYVTEIQDWYNWLQSPDSTSLDADTKSKLSSELCDISKAYAAAATEFNNLLYDSQTPPAPIVADNPNQLTSFDVYCGQSYWSITGAGNPDDGSGQAKETWQKDPNETTVETTYQNISSQMGSIQKSVVSTQNFYTDQMNSIEGCFKDDIDFLKGFDQATVSAEKSN